MRLPFSEPESDNLHLTPLIDVVFLLLIFFLVATRFDQEEREISTKLPDVVKAQPMAMGPSELVVNITRDGRYIVVGKKYSEAELGQILRSHGHNKPGSATVLIRADERVPFRHPARVMGLCEQAKLKHYCSVILQHE